MKVSVICERYVAFNSNNKQGNVSKKALNTGVTLAG